MHHKIRSCGWLLTNQLEERIKLIGFRRKFLYISVRRNLQRSARNAIKSPNCKRNCLHASNGTFSNSLHRIQRKCEKNVSFFCARVSKKLVFKEEEATVHGRILNHHHEINFFFLAAILSISIAHLLIKERESHRGER